MSATDWDVCPQCIKHNNKDILQAEQDLEDQYGKVDAKEYLRLKGKFDKRAVEVLSPTLREDYYQGISTEGKYEVSYRASCDKCGYSFNYKYSVITKLE